jgi:hypothetical protein
LLLSVTTSVNSFQSPHLIGHHQLHRQLNLLCSSLKSGDVSDALKDSSGAIFTVGSTVRVATAGLKAFQMNIKGRGSFDEKKVFQHIPEQPYFLLPEGLRGVVTKVYSEDQGVSANFPIQVKFQPGEWGEGFDPPAALSMHFSPTEVAVVS